MKYQMNQHKAEFLGSVQSMGGFKIKASGKAFQALTGDLYSNCIGANIRELSCNAGDAHRDSDRINGTTTQVNTPFDVHLPTELEPYFFVRDYGTGISHDNMENVYCVVFESTKDSSEDDIGCFGLGSKTPLSYNTKSFNVTSYQNGKERNYTSFFKEDGTPDIAYHGEQDTDEPDGLKVYIACRKEDIPAFKENAQKYLKHFQSPAANVLNPSFKFEKENVSIEGDGWRLLEGRDASYILMGCVPYPLNMRNVVQSCIEENKTIANELYTVINSCETKGMYLEITVPIGYVSPQLSREALYYDERTSENILSAIKAVRDDLTQKVQDKLSELKSGDSYFKSCLDYTNYAERKFSFLSNNSISGPTWEGDIPVKYTDAFSGWLVRTILNLNDIHVSFTLYSTKYSYKRYSTNYSVKAERSCHFDFKEVLNSYIVVNPDSKDSKSRIRHWLKNNSSYKVLVFEGNDFHHFRNLLGLKDEDITVGDAEEFEFDRNKLNYLKASEMKQAPRKNSVSVYVPKEGRVTKDSVRVNLKYTNEDGETESTYQEDILLYRDEESKVIYYSINDDDNIFIDEDGLIEKIDLSHYENANHFHRFSSIFEDDNWLFDDFKVVGIKGKKDCKSLKKAKEFGWISIDDYLLEWLEENKELMINQAKSRWLSNNFSSQNYPESILLQHYGLKKMSDYFKELESSERFKVIENIPYFNVYDHEEYQDDELKEMSDILKKYEKSPMKELVSDYKAKLYDSFNMKALKKAALFQIKYGFNEDFEPIEPIIPGTEVENEEIEEIQEEECCPA